MIVKKVLGSKTKNKAASIRDLVNYIVKLQDRATDEKLLYASGRGFFCDDRMAQCEEMVALATESIRSKSPVNHYILSWREGEQPSSEQVEEAVTIFMDEFGWKDHQAIYGLHKDTDNVHLHIAINRVHPDTSKIVEVNNGFDIETAHRAIARIEHAQGWQREQNGRYQVLENGDLSRSTKDSDKRRQPDQKKLDMEHRTGEKSALRIAIEDGASIIKKAQSWEELHRELATKGMRYEKTGSGATVFVGDIGVKASDVDRNASFSKVQKRLGEYQAASKGNLIVSREVESVESSPDVSRWKKYIAERKAYYTQKNAAKLELDRQQERERKTLQVQYRFRRNELMLINWKHKGDALNAMRSVLAAKYASERADLQDKHRNRRSLWREQFPFYPDFEQWLRMQGRQDLAEQWRYRTSEPQHIEGDSLDLPKPRDIRAYQAEIVGKQVYYTSKDEQGIWNSVSFVDKGKIIDIYNWRNQDSTLAALQLASQKWGKFTVIGSDEYKSMCVKLAARHGFQIANPELQESIQKEQSKIQQDRLEAMKSTQLKQFERYADAIGAERYRVTSIKMYENGGKQTFILDKKDGVTKGFTCEEIAQHTPEMQKLQRRGENIYYTPLSEKKHHILVDDIDRVKLERFINDGYQPAVLLESSPGNYQAVLTIPKLGTPYDKDVGNRLSEALNREYGDPKLSGAIHPHRAPGYENRKSKHQREDGSYPEVRLLKAERRECAKSLALSSQIDIEYQQQAVLKAERMKYQTKPLEQVRSSEALASGNHTTDIYQKHYRDILKRQGSSEIDLSRVDSMVAIRMRATGHNQQSVEDTIRQCAPTIRQKEESRDWDDYAQRTARYAYSTAGDRQIVQLAKYKSQWERLEGKEPEQRMEKMKQREMGSQERSQQEQVKTQKTEHKKSHGISR